MHNQVLFVEQQEGQMLDSDDRPSGGSFPIRDAQRVCDNLDAWLPVVKLKLNHHSVELPAT